MSSYEYKLKNFLEKEKDPMSELRMKAKVLSKAFKEAFPKWKEDPKVKKFVDDLDRDPEGLVQLQDEEGIFLK